MRLALLLLPLCVAACSAPRLPLVGRLPGADDIPFVHRIDVQQGNVITQDMLAQLRRGMDKKKVTFIMGSPIVQDTFNADRWDYLYTFQSGRDQPERRLVTLYFVDDKLDSLGGDVTPASGELVATLHHDLTVRVPRYVPKNFVERVVDKLPFTGDDEEQKVEVLSVEEAAADHASATARDAAADAETELAAVELEQPVQASPYENIQAAPGEGVIVPPDAPSNARKKGFFARLLGGLAADEEDDDDDAGRDGGKPEYRDITDQSNI
ncbi:MAG: outer membrane protein assembly factor BamE [Gammaproteobacteria bacterium]